MGLGEKEERAARNKGGGGERGREERKKGVRERVGGGRESKEGPNSVFNNKPDLPGCC